MTIRELTAGEIKAMGLSDRLVICRTRCRQSERSYASAWLKCRVKLNGSEDNAVSSYRNDPANALSQTLADERV